MARGDVFCVITTSVSTGSSASMMPRASLSPKMPSTPIRRVKSKSRSSAAASACAPCGLWVASMKVVGVARTRSRRPGEVVAAKPSRTVSASSVRSDDAPRNASTAASATEALWAWCGPDSGMNTSAYSPDRPFSVSVWPPTATSEASTPNSWPKRATGAPISTVRSRITRIASGSCWPITATASALRIIPAFSPAISAMVSPR